VKRFENIFRTIFVVTACLLLTTATKAQTQTVESMDSVEFGLITCSPHEEVYSLYGHSAIHYHDLRSGRHFVFNWGVFDFKKSGFVWRFMMGKTDYVLECTPYFNDYCNYYRKWGSQVVEQILDLTNEEKVRLSIALRKNLDNPVYRYNFFFDNCATRPRNIIEQSLTGRVSYAERPDDKRSFRQLIHEKTSHHPWSTFGNDLLLGLTADRTATQREQEFLPELLRLDFDRATVERQGEVRPLVKERRELVKPGVQMVEKDFPLSPLFCFCLLLALSVAILAYELRKGKTAVWWDVLLMLLTGLPGIIIVLMFFSEHPATSSNLQVLLLNPLPLLFIPSVIKRRKTRWFTISMYLTVAFLIGGFWQDYAEGMYCLALCLLLRYWRHVYGK